MTDKKKFYSEFLDFMVKSGALLFGDFTLKSGRKSPYFINTGEYKTGLQLSKLGEFYARLIRGSVTDSDSITAQNDAVMSRFNVLFGPAYKGIPLVTAAAAKLAEDGLSLNVAFDRKERKDHGEGNVIMGYLPQPGDKIAIVEDVTTAGTSVRETAALLDRLGTDAKITALYISVDRQERGAGNISAADELGREFGISVFSIATVRDIIDYLENPPSYIAPVPNAKDHAKNIRAYLKEYGAES